MKDILLFLIVFISVTFNNLTQAQDYFNKKEVDEILNNLDSLTTKLPNSENTKTLKYIQEIYPRIKEDSTKVILLQKLIFLYDRLGETEKKMQTYLDAKKLLQHTGSIRDRVLFNYLIGETYTQLKMFDLANKNFDEADQLAVKDPKNSLQYEAASFIMRGNLLFHEAKYEKCIEYVNNTLRNLKPSNPVKTHYELYGFQAIALSSFELKKYKDAEIYVKKVLELNHKPHVDFSIATNNLYAKILMQKGEIDSAINCLNSMNVEDGSNYKALLVDRADIFAKLYLLKKDFKNSSKYTEIKDSIGRIIKNQEYKGLEKTINDAEDAKITTEKNRNIIIIIFSLLLLLALIGAIVLSFKRKSDKIKFQKIIEDLKKPLEYNAQIIKDEPITTDNNTHTNDEILFKENKILSDEKEDELLRTLDKYEKSEKYLSQNTSLSNVATLLKTNQTYLSEVINMHKGVNFSQYIHQLRINYIMRKLSTEPEFLKYKIAYLAEICGYSSYETFTRIFKAITGLSPSTFIAELSKNQQINSEN